MFIKGLFFLFFLFLGCSPQSLEDLRVEAEGEIERLVEDLRRIETKDSLQKAVPKIKKRFNKIADLLVETRKFPKSASPPLEVSERLFIELARLYEIPGGKELLESAERDAVEKLQARH